MSAYERQMNETHNQRVSIASAIEAKVPRIVSDDFNFEAACAAIRTQGIVYLVPGEPIVQIASPLLGKLNPKTGVTPADMDSARYEEALTSAAPLVLP